MRAIRARARSGGMIAFQARMSPMWRYAFNRLLVAARHDPRDRGRHLRDGPRRARRSPPDPHRRTCDARADAQARAAYGLDRPVWEQLAVYIWKAVRLDFGHSIVQGVPVAQLVLWRMPATLLLAA